jgi:predicted DNA-binding ribbon-helix-helix protein
VSVENAFWEALKEIAASRHIKLQGLISMIDSDREHDNLSSAIRLFVLNHYRALVDQARLPMDPTA